MSLHFIHFHQEIESLKLKKCKIDERENVLLKLKMRPEELMSLPSKYLFSTHDTLCHQLHTCN